MAHHVPKGSFNFISLSEWKNIDLRKKENSKSELTFVGVKSAEIKNFEKKDNIYIFTVNFISEIITCKKDKNNEVIEGNPDILINAAGLNTREHADDVTIDGCDKTLDLNLSYHFLKVFYQDLFFQGLDTFVLKLISKIFLLQK